MFLVRNSSANAIKKCNSLSLLLRASVRASSVSSSEPTSANQDISEVIQKISVPYRINRSPTAVLQALAATIGEDTTAAHYKYHDDPYLMPTTNLNRKNFALAQESGRKAARWIRDEHRNLFMHKNADPPVPAFFPKMVFTEDSSVDETCLTTLISNGETVDAVFVYNLMKTKKLPISNEVKQAMLELVCFYNNEEAPTEEFIEEYLVKQENTGRERSRKTWKDGDQAEQIFKDIEPKTSEAYSAIIRGMCKYFQAERGYALYQEALNKNIELNTKTYNALINIASLLRDTADLKWDLVKDLLKQMNERQLKPDVRTLNACLSTVSSIGNTRLARNAALQTLSEFKKIGIVPSLGTWYYMLIIFCRERGPVSHVIVDILNEIEGREFKITDVKDTFFFVTAMDVCRNHLLDKTLAKRVDALLHTGNNFDLIGDPNKESIYYRHYFALLCQTEPIEEFMKTYNLLVPNVYIPEPGIMLEILKMIDTNGHIELVPKLWSDMVIFDHVNRERLLTIILKIMCDNKPNPEIASHEGLVQKFGDIANDIFNKIEEESQSSRIKKNEFTGQMLGDILKLVSEAGQWEEAQKVFTKIDRNQHLISGAPSPDSIEVYLDLCIKEKSPTSAISCLEYSAENGYDSIKMAKKIRSAFTLNENHENKIRRITGDDSSDDE